MTLHPRSLTAAAIGALGLAAVALNSANATITVVADYQLGEADLGAAPGDVSTGSVDSSGNGFDLSANGSPVYSSDVPVHPASPSSLSAQFDGNSYFSGPTVTDATENFGIEAWVKTSDLLQSPGGIAINGSGCCSGFGLFVDSGFYYGLYGGVDIIPIGSVTADEWTEIAIVDEDGLTTSYLNGIAQFSDFYGDPNPASAPACCNPALFMTIGSDGSHNYDGLIDDVRVFTFADGQFSASDLNIPEPASLALLGAGLAGLGFARRRKT